MSKPIVYPARFLDLPERMRLWRWTPHDERPGMETVIFALETPDEWRTWTASAGTGQGAACAPSADAVAIAQLPALLRSEAARLDWQEGTIEERGSVREGMPGAPRGRGRPARAADGATARRVVVRLSEAEAARLDRIITATGQDAASILRSALALPSV